MSRSRGQTMLLFALTMFVIVLMAMMTLSMGSRVKDRMELQSAADAAAYNSAVATARAFNSVAVMNRVQVAHAVSTLGTLSLISWSTLYWKHADNAAKLFKKMAMPYAFNTIIQCLPPPKPMCKPCVKGLAQTLALAVLSRAHASKTKSRLMRDVNVFNQETERRWRAAERIHASQVELLARLDDYAGRQAAEDVLRSARPRAPGEVRVESAGAAISLREREEAVTDYASAVAGAEPHHVGHLVMASRGHPFVRKRKEHADWDKLFSGGSLSLRGKVVFAGGHIFYSGSRGSSYDDRSWTTNPSGRPYGPLAHDGQGGKTRTFFVPASPKFKNWVKCSSPLPAFVIATAIGLSGKGVKMGDASVSADDHQGIGHRVQHAFRTFPPFVDYNANALLDSDNLYGQPKVVSVLSRDPQSRDVWEQDGSFRFTSSGARLSMGASSTKQVAIGTGLVYYHRAQHALEPPNLFAPYWRGGLTRFSVDRPPPGGSAAWDSQAQSALNGAGANGEAFGLLQSQGFGAVR